VCIYEDKNRKKKKRHKKPRFSDGLGETPKGDEFENDFAPPNYDHGYGQSYEDEGRQIKENEEFNQLETPGNYKWEKPDHQKPQYEGEGEGMTRQ